jgi:hypothetical protein
MEVKAADLYTVSVQFTSLYVRKRNIKIIPYIAELSSQYNNQIYKKSNKIITNL